VVSHRGFDKPGKARAGREAPRVAPALA